MTFPTCTTAASCAPHCILTWFPFLNKLPVTPFLRASQLRISCITETEDMARCVLLQQLGAEPG